AEVRVKGLSEAAGLVYAGARQVILAAIGIASGLASLQLYLAGHLPLARNCLYGSGAMFALLFLSMIFTRSRR
ncbi:MAG: hypothetical protein ABI193_19025, partial [Minicystis sp.]